MERIKNVIKVLFIIITLVSCTSELETVRDTSLETVQDTLGDGNVSGSDGNVSGSDGNVSGSDGNVSGEKLKSIIKLTYNGDVLQWSQKMNFVNDELVKIKHKDGSYDLISYINGLLSEIEEFSAIDDLEWTTTYTYDNLNRLEVKKVAPSSTNSITDVSRQKNFSYDENQIQSISSWSDGGLHKNSILINAEKFIIEDKLYSSNDDLVGSFLFSYSDENLSKLTNKDHNGSIRFEIAYNYLNEMPSNYYNYKKYLFGNEWKNNVSLDKQFGLGQYDSFEISKNYVKDYYFNDFENNNSKTGTFEYEFDSAGTIIMQTENINYSNGNKFKIITKFEYEE